MRNLFRLLVLANIVLLPLAIALFGERFRLWSMPLSDLGTLRTRGGLDNHAAFTVFALYMIAGCVIMIACARSCLRHERTPFRRLKAAAALLAALGFLVGLFPHDLFQPLHTAGCSLMAGGLWVLANVFSLELHRAGRTRPALIVQASLQLTVLPYAAAFFADSNAKQALQKIAVIGLLLAVSLATRILREAVLVNTTRLAGWANESVGREKERDKSGEKVRA